MTLSLISPHDLDRITDEIVLFTYGRYKRLVIQVKFKENRPKTTYIVYHTGHDPLVTDSYVTAKRAYNNATVK